MGAPRRAEQNSRQLSLGDRRPSGTGRIDDDRSGAALSSFDSEQPAGNAAGGSSGIGDPRPKNGPRMRVFFAGALLVCLVIAVVLVMRFARTSDNRSGPTATSEPESSVQRPQAATGSTELRPQPSTPTAPAVRSAPHASDSKTPERRATPSQDALKRPTRPPAGRSSDVGIRTPPMPSAAVARSAPPPASTTVAPLPAPSPLNPEALPAPALAIPVPTAGTLSTESIALDQMLNRYEQAYDRLDARAVASIWPSVDSRALSRAFARLREQDLELGNCSFAISENAATAQCSGQLRYAQRVGDTTPKSERHVWTIQFAGVGEVWRIVRVSAQ
jgi:hypothetical protein